MAMNTPSSSAPKMADSPRLAPAMGLSTRFSGRHSGCGASAGKPSGALALSEDSIGISVSETMSDIRMAMAMVSAWSLNSCPATPSTNTSGRNTATVVSVDATTAMLTSCVPAMAACSTPSPRSRAFAMLSSTTIESSTTRPVARARPPSDITFRLSPNWSMKKNVAMSEIGSDSAMTNVLQPSRRKKKMIRMASRPPSMASNSTSASASSMNTDWSSTVVSTASAGRFARRRSMADFTSSATLTVFASPSL